MTKEELGELAKYVPKPHREKFLREVEAWERLWHDLQKTHEEKWVAVHNGRMVDMDDDEQALYDRVRAKYSNVVVLIMQVLKDAPCPTYTLPGIDTD